MLIDTLIVHWPAGNRQILTDLSANQNLSILEVTNVSNEAFALQEDVLSFDLFPSLITDSVDARMQVQNPLRLGQQQGHVYVYNILGQVLHQKPIQIPEGRSEVLLDIPSLNLASGVYYVLLQTDGNRLTQQMIIR